MKKFSKIVAMVLALVMVVALLVGCSLFGIDTARYRSQVAFKVGDEDVTVGVVTDLYTNLFYQYYNYVANGQLTNDDLFNMAIESLYTSYSKLDAYKHLDNVLGTVSAKVPQDSRVANLEYLNDMETEYAYSYIKYSLFVALDSTVESYIASEVAKLAEDVHDHDQTDERAFNEPDKMYYENAEGTKVYFDSYADKMYYDNTFNTEVAEYIEKYYANLEVYTLGLDGYVYTQEQAAAKVDNINKRLKQYEDDNADEELPEDHVYPTIDAAQYIAWQEKATKSFTNSVENNYDQTVEQYARQQLFNTVITLIGRKWDYNTVASKIEADKTQLVEALVDKYTVNKNAFTASINMNQSTYLTFIGSLADSNYIYDIPDMYQGDFIFVKNLLIPFSAKQTAQLTNLANVLGGTGTEAYIKARNQLAAEIVATDFSITDEEAEDQVTGLFSYDEGNNKIVLQGELAEKLVNNGNLQPDAFVELMKKYNTDTAQHSRKYEYVAYVGPDTNAYTSPWVAEFDAAVKEAYALGQYHYGIAVSQYGVHIVYYSKPVAAWQQDFEGFIDSFATHAVDTTSFEYSYFTTYYTDQQNLLSTSANEDLTETYRYGGKITMSKGLSHMIKELGLSFDFEESITKEDEE